MAITTSINVAEEIWRGLPPRWASAYYLSAHQLWISCQCQTNWCWVAVLHEILRCRKTYISQCHLVEKHQYSSGTCNCDAPALVCDPTVRSPCNTKGSVGYYLMNTYPPAFMLSPSDLTPKLLCDELQADRPVVARFENGGDKHYAVISRLTTSGGGYQIEITDPFGGRRLGPLSWQADQVFEHPDQERGTLQAIFILR